MTGEIIKKLKQSNWTFWIPTALIVLYTYNYVADYIKTKNSVYGKKANTLRQSLGIPIIEDYLKPTAAPTDKYEGIRWETKKNPNSYERLIHRWKMVSASERNGWLEENDAIRYYIDDTTSYQLNLTHKIYDDSVSISGTIAKVDIRKESIDDYFSGKYPRSDWSKLNRSQIDSIQTAWKNIN